MKKALLALFICIVLSLTACTDEDYAPVDSTDEEARVVMTLTIEGERYDVKYELYRAMFLNHKSSVDKGDASVWQGDDADEYINEINEIIKDRISDIYSVFYMANELGIDPYSNEIEEQIKEYIKISVDGNGADVVGYGGSYEAYLAALKEMNLNYSVQVLLIRYSLTLEKINEYYIGTSDDVLGNIGGKYEFTERDVREYYFSDDSRRILHAYMSESVTDADERMSALRQSLINADNDMAAALLIINTTAVTPTDLIKNKTVSGILVGRNTLDNNFYDAYTDTVFTLKPGEVSELVRISDSENGTYLIYMLDKSEEHFESAYEDIVSSYLDNLIGKRLYEIGNELEESAKTTDAYKEIAHGSISIK